jgi:hypothetical protein
MRSLLDTVPGLVTVVETMKSVCHSERRSKSRHCVPLFYYALIVRNGYEMYVCTTSRTFSGGALTRIVVSSVALNQAVMVGVSVVGIFRYRSDVVEARRAYMQVCK